MELKDHYYAFWLEPINHKKTIEHMEIYYVGEEAAISDKYKNIRKENFNQWKNIMAEDLDIIEGMQEEEIHQFTMVEIFTCS